MCITGLFYLLYLMWNWNFFVTWQLLDFVMFKHMMVFNIVVNHILVQKMFLVLNKMFVFDILSCHKRLWHNSPISCVLLNTIHICISSGSIVFIVRCRCHWSLHEIAYFELPDLKILRCWENRSKHMSIIIRSEISDAEVMVRNRKHTQTIRSYELRCRCIG